MCVFYDKGTDQILAWSRHHKCFVPYTDWMAGADTFPGYEAPILTPMRLSSPQKQKQLVLGNWGLVPKWAKDPSFGRKNAFNARSETIREKPSFREAFRTRRCVIPCTGFYEPKDGRWMKVLPVGEEVIAMAGIYEEAHPVSGALTFAVVTTEPNSVVSQVQDRMPVILAEKDIDGWLDAEAEDGYLTALMSPCPDAWLMIEDSGPISPRKKKEEDDQGTLF